MSVCKYRQYTITNQSKSSHRAYKTFLHIDKCRYRITEKTSWDFGVKVKFTQQNPFLFFVLFAYYYKNCKFIL